MCYTHVFIYLCSVAIRIVFEESEYTVNEGDRRVEVCAEVEPQDALERQVEATLSTRDGTARG